MPFCESIVVLSEKRCDVADWKTAPDERKHASPCFAQMQACEFLTWLRRLARLAAVLDQQNCAETPPHVTRQDCHRMPDSALVVVRNFLEVAGKWSLFNDA